MCLQRAPPLYFSPEALGWPTTETGQPIDMLVALPAANEKEGELR
jgi:hypothetical protein